MFKRLLNTLGALVFSNECEACAVPLPPSLSALCVSCASLVLRIEPPYCPRCGRTTRCDEIGCGQCSAESFAFDKAFACAYYEGPLREVLHAYKFNGRRELKNYLAEMMLSFVREQMPEERFDAVLAVPLSSNRLKERGFNQSALLASRIAADLGLPYLRSGLKRSESLSPQSLLDRRKRKLNVRGRFTTAASVSFKNKRLLLVDDVLTTGQTASECARTLKEAGGASVTVLVCARGL